MQTGRLIIKAKPRIHITLIGMNSDGFRINGGAGFAIDEPSIKLSFECAKNFKLTDNRKNFLSAEEINRISNIINQVKKQLNLSHNINAEISGDMPSHFGFGSSTAIRLSCLEALYILNELKINPEQIVLSSGRGGTSGIGINTYFLGGFIIDLGRKLEDNPSHNPSSLSENRLTLPLMMQRLEMPDWEIGICIPKTIPNKNDDEEKKFFLKTCPISSSSAYEILYNVIYGLYSSIREKDKETFCRAINAIQECSWKLAERKEYGEELFKLEQQLYDAGANSVGMSSLGPSLFFFAENGHEVIRKIDANCHLFITKPANEGRSINV